MLQSLPSERALGHRYALCVGIGTYTNLANRNLRYAVDDATKIAERLADPQKGSFAVTLLTQPIQTTKAALEEAVEQLLSASERQAEDLTLLYFSCHGDIERTENTFCLLPSNATLQANEIYEKTTVIGVLDLARWFSKARARNIVLILDVCHSGGAGVAFQNFQLNLEKGLNFFILGAARLDQVTTQSSKLEQGVFTHCLLRAFGQRPTKDGWLTISQIQNFVSSDISWFAKDQPLQPQMASFFVYPDLPLLRNPGYPELYPLPPLWNVPFKRNDFFTGQEEVLSQLAGMLQGEQKSALMQPYAISGLGGIGKTQLALEYAYRHRQDYHAILWVNADTREHLIKTFVEIAKLLDLPQQEEKKEMDIVEAVKEWLADRNGWLLILDNADELALAEEFIPPAFRGHLLLTTRTQIVGSKFRKFEVEAMRPEIGSLLLLRRSKLLAPQMTLEQAPPAVIKQAQELVQDLGGLPLALDQAAAYVDETQCGLEQYLQRYRTRRMLLLQRRGELVDHPGSVATTLSLSLEKAAEKAAQLSLVAVNVMQLCAYLSPDAIPEELFTIRADWPELVLAPVAADDFELDEAIAALRSYSLVSRDRDTHTLTVHRLVQAVIEDSLSAKEQRQWMQRAVQAVAAACPEKVDFANWPAMERLLPHALTCTTWIEQAPDASLAAALLLNQTGNYLDHRARYEEAEPLLKRVLAIYKQHLGATHPMTASSLNNLATLYYQQGKYEKAELLLVRALAIREQLLGTEHPDTAISLNSLAALYQAQGKYEQAEPLLQRVLAINEQRLGAMHPLTAIGLNNLAAIYYTQGKYEQAEPLLKRALAIYEQQLGAEHPDTATGLDNLAELYRAQGKYEQAEPLFQRALAIYEQQLGATHPDTAQSLNNLAELYRAQGKYEQAELLFQRALAIREQQLGAEHPETAQSLNNLSELYYTQGKYEQAEPLLKRALAIYEQQLGATHPNTATGLNNLAALYRAQDMDEQAEPLLEQAQALNEQQPGAYRLFHQRDQRWSQTRTQHLRQMKSSPPSLERIWNVPFLHNVFFTGRTEILETIRHGFTSSEIGPLKSQALCGIAGIGKTQIALEYAHHYRNEYDAILWVKADSLSVLTSDFVSLAYLLNLDEKNEQDESLVIQAVKLWFDRHSKWLLIFDGADDLQLMWEFLPPAGSGHILMTTQTQSVRRLIKRIVVEQMNAEEGMRFLLRRANLLLPEDTLEHVAFEETALAKEIVELMEGHPLALDQAGAYIEETNCSLSDYLHDYQAHQIELLKSRGDLTFEHPELVVTAISLSMDKVRRANFAAFLLLNFLAFLHPDTIPEEIITEGSPYLGSLRSVASDPHKLHEVISQLLKYSLISRNPEKKALQMHRLIQTLSKNKMKEETQRLWSKRAVQAVNQVFASLGSWEQERYWLYMPHVHECEALIKQWGITSWEAVELLGTSGVLSSQKRPLR